MKDSNIKTKVLSGLVWKFGERISAQVVTFVVSIVLARLLSPADYGAIAIVNIFITLANVFVASGFGNSLIQKKDADDTDYSSVFYFNLIMGFVLFLVIYITAPYIAKFYRMDILCPVLRFMGLKLIVAGVNGVQQAYVSKHMMFKRFFWSTLGATLVSAIIGVAMAYMGYGIWALAMQYMVNSTISTIVLWFTVKWRPKLLFSLKRLGGLFSYGWKLLVSSLLDTGYNELRSLVIGGMYTVSDLAYYNKGRSFPNLIVTNINTSIQSVLFPAMSESQDVKENVKAMTRRSIRTSSYIMFPLMAGLALVAEPFVEFLLTEKWLPCVPFLQIACVTYAFMPIHTANLQAINAMGRSDLFLKLEIIKKTVGIIALVISVQYGVIAIALSGIITTLISSVVNSFPNRKLLGYTYIDQIKDLFSCIVPLLFMMIAVYLISLTKMGVLVMLTVQIVVGALVYVFVSYITKNESFNYILSTIKEVLSKRRTA